MPRSSSGAPTPDGRRLIDGLRSSDGSLDAAAVRAILPYGEEFLFVDRVVRLSEEAIEATYLVPPDAPYLRGHFVGFPILPGALAAEGFAQAGSLLVRYRLEAPQEKEIIAMQIESARFSRPAFPGDTLTYRARLVTFGRRAARLEGDIGRGGEEIGRLRVVVGIVDRRAYREAARRR